MFSILLLSICLSDLLPGMTNILITGKNSYIGNNFIRYSSYKSIKEISLIDNQPEKIDFSNVDVVLHLAAIVHQSKKIPESEYFKVNRDLSIHTAIKARNDGVKVFIYLSTLKVYGDFNPDNLIRNENSPCFPVDSYGKSKYEAENELRKLENRNFKVSIVRTPLVYGEDVKANMLKLIRLADRFRILPFKGVNNKRNFTYIENLTGFIERIIETKESGVFVVMDDHAISTSELVRYLAENLKKKICLIKLPGFLINVGRFFKPDVFDSLFGSLEVNNDKTKEILDYKPPFTTEAGLRKMVTSYLLQKNKNRIHDITNS